MTQIKHRLTISLSLSLQGTVNETCIAWDESERWVEPLVMCVCVCVCV